MLLTKRQINKKLKSKILEPLTINDSNTYLDNFKIIVTRARLKDYDTGFDDLTDVRSKTLVTIKVSGNVLSSTNKLKPLRMYGPRSIRRYIRRKHNGITGSVSNWVKLWGFSNEVELERIEII